MILSYQTQCHQPVGRGSVRELTYRMLGLRHYLQPVLRTAGLTQEPSLLDVEHYLSGKLHLQKRPL
ncbi:Uncharacterised protein [Vibrio cholerae]|uniref:Uncharacterized protein n=1 Tax=Vibrio cholerae TaxID=666 RepID=A0A655ZWP8_VIBCL|nr:Uncharacterised protein [Vibrio cholerae]CSI84079.1 Uncharacterised protein [Vibrio cholerae]